MQKNKKNAPIKAAGTRLSSCANAGLAGISTANSASDHPIRERILFLRFINVPSLQSLILRDLPIAPGNTGSRTRVERSNFRAPRLFGRADHLVRDAFVGYYWPHFIQLVRLCQKTSAIVARAVPDTSIPIKPLTAYPPALQTLFLRSTLGRALPR